MEQRKRESLIPKGTFEFASAAEEDQRGDVSGTFLRPVIELPPAPVARIELRRQVLPPPPPRTSLRPTPAPVAGPISASVPKRSLVPPPVPNTPPPPSLGTLVAPSYPPRVAAPERVDFQDFALRLDVPQMAPPPSSLLPPPVAAQPRSWRGVWIALLMVGVGAAGWFSRGLLVVPADPQAPTSSVKPIALSAREVAVAQAILTEAAAPEAAAPEAAVVENVAPAVAVAENVAPAVAAAESPALPAVAPVAVARAHKPKVSAVAVIETPAVVQALEAATVEAADLDEEEHAPPLEAALIEAIPETLEREEVVEGIELLRNEYQACAGDLHGVAEIKITIANTGRITHALVGGDYTGTPQGSCLARTLRQARFRSFQEPRLEVVYPIAL